MLADFILFLQKEKHLSVSAIRWYSSTLSAVFKYRLPDICTSFALRDLIRSFELEHPSTPVGPPFWDLVKVLEYLCGPVFEPLSSNPLRVVMVKTLILLSLAMAKRVGELQVLSRRVVSQGPDICLSYLPESVAKTESERNPLPLSFLVKSLSEFVGDLPEERLLCLVRAVRVYLDTTSSLIPRPRSLFVSPCCPLRALSKNPYRSL